MRSSLAAALVAILSILTFAVTGCGSKFTAPETAQLPEGAVSPATEAILRGYVYQINPVILVPDPALAPTGSEPRGGAAVRALDAEGKLLGLAVTGDDGFFQLELQGAGLTKIDVRLDPGGADPDVETYLTRVPGHTMIVGATDQSAVTRAQAIATVQGEFSSDSLVSASLNPIPAGTVISDPGGSFLTELTEDSWLIFERVFPNAGFPNQTRLYLVGSQSGDSSTNSGSFYPFLNGEPIYAGVFECVDLSVVDFEDPVFPDNFQPQAYPNFVQGPAGLFTPVTSKAIAGPLFANNTDAGSVFALLVAGSKEPAFAASCRLIEKKLIEQGVPAANIEVVVLPGLSMDAAARKFYNSKQILEARMRERRSNGLHSTLVYYHASHGGPQGIFFNDKASIGAGILAAPFREGLGLLGDTNACRVRVLIDTCNSGAFTENIEKLIDGNPERYSHIENLVLYSACRNGAFSLFYDPGFLSFTAPRTIWGELVSQQLRVENGDLLGLSEIDFDNPQAATLLSPAKDTLGPDDLPNDPQLAVRRGRICTGDSKDIVGPPISPATVRIKNGTERTLVFLLSSLTHTLNDGQPITLAPGEIFEQQVTGDLKRMTVVDLTNGGKTFAFGGKRFNVPAATTLELCWEDRGGCRTVKIVTDGADVLDALTPEGDDVLLEVNKSFIFKEYDPTSSPCPFEVGEFVVSNTSGIEVQGEVVIEGQQHLSFVPDRFTLAPGTSQTVKVLYNCTADASFRETVKVSVPANSTPGLEKTLEVEVRFLGISVDTDLTTPGEQTEIQFEHIVGDTACPQNIGTVTITNRGEAVDLQLVPGSFLNVVPANLITLGAGQTQTYQVFFNCGTTQPFTSGITIDPERSVTVSGNVR